MGAGLAAPLPRPPPRELRSWGVGPVFGLVNGSGRAGHDSQRLRADLNLVINISSLQLSTAIRERFQAFDISGDGVLSKKEFMDAFASMASVHPVVLCAIYVTHYLTNIPKLPTQFRTARAPAISMHVLSALPSYSRPQGKEMTGAELDELMLTFDVDQSHTIDAVRLAKTCALPFPGMIRALPPEQRLGPALSKSFHGRFVPSFLH